MYRCAISWCCICFFNIYRIFRFSIIHHFSAIRILSSTETEDAVGATEGSGVNTSTDGKKKNVISTIFEGYCFVLWGIARSKKRTETVSFTVTQASNSRLFVFIFTASKIRGSKLKRTNSMIRDTERQRKNRRHRVRTNEDTVIHCEVTPKSHRESAESAERFKYSKTALVLRARFRIKLNPSGNHFRAVLVQQVAEAVLFRLTQ